MSALGHKRTISDRASLSALPPKADTDDTTGIPQKFAQRVRSEMAVYRRVVKQAGIPLQ